MSLEVSLRINYAIVFVSDMANSIAFYRDVIGLTLRFESPHWTEFETEGATLALHVGEDERPAGGVPREAPGTCRTGFEVPNLDEFHARMIAHEVPCLQEPTMTFGARIAMYEDPDGMAISVGEKR